MAASASEAVSPSEWFQYRVEKLAKRQAEKGIQTYPHKFQTTISIADYIARFEKLEAGNRDDSEDFSVAGRIVGHRASGAKLNFYEIRGEGAKMQVFFDAKSFQGDYVEVAGTIHRGDIVGITGFPMRTKRGELSIVPRQLVLLSPCLKPLPGAQNELTEQETRYRNRHLDLIANHDRVRKIFETRTGIIKHIRRYLDDRRFLEVETPMMTAVAGGAAARPFITHHNDLNIDVFLRISPELYLKQLVVGGLERVYEIGRQMRNEGLDLTHNPEFTSCEFYMAYADYHDLITMTEELLSSMALSLKGTTKVMVVPFSGDKSKDPVEIDFAPPYRRVSMIAELERICGVAFPRPLDGPECNAFLRELCASRGVECSPPTTTARLIDKLVGEYIEPTCINPTFICDHPQLMSPLAKWHRDNPELTERFELFINGKEICNAYTELNNPHVQRQCFADQLKDKEAGDIEAQMIDETFCDALDHGLPPTGGWGIGIDRLTMMLTGQNNIKEVVLFPAMRPLPSASSPEKEPEAAAPVPATETVSPSS